MKKLYDAAILFSSKDGKEIALQIVRYLKKKHWHVFEVGIYDNDNNLSKEFRYHLSHAAHYFFIATPDAFRICKEGSAMTEGIRLLLECYEYAENQSFLMPIDLIGKDFPQADELPKSIRNITLPNRIDVSGKTLTNADLESLYYTLTTPNHRNLWYAAKRNAFCHKFDLPDRIQAIITNDVQKENIHIIGGKPEKIIANVFSKAFENSYYNRKSIVPLYTDLSKLPKENGRWYANGISHAILYEITRQLCCEDKFFPNDLQFATRAENVEKLFEECEEKPEYLLMLAGIDFLSKGSETEIKDLVTQEILTMLEEYENMRIMLFSKGIIDGIPQSSPRYTLNTVQV